VVKKVERSSIVSISTVPASKPNVAYGILGNAVYLGNGIGFSTRNFFKKKVLTQTIKYKQIVKQKTKQNKPFYTHTFLYKVKQVKCKIMPIFKEYNIKIHHIEI
jgi:hypothetical protein